MKIKKRPVIKVKVEAPKVSRTEGGQILITRNIVVAPSREVDMELIHDGFEEKHVRVSPIDVYTIKLESIIKDEGVGQ